MGVTIIFCWSLVLDADACRWVDYARWVGVQKDRGADVASAIESAAAAIEDAASSAGVAPS
jgi:hypothetical protein